MQILSIQGRGRLFIREALQHRLLVNAIELLADNPSLLSVSVIKWSVVSQQPKPYVGHFYQMVSCKFLCTISHGQAWGPIFKNLITNS